MLISHKPMKWNSYTLVVMVVSKSFSRSENLVLSQAHIIVGLQNSCSDSMF